MNEPENQPLPEGDAAPKRGLAAPLWLALGWVFVALGTIGAFLPVMPTTVFIILAAGCFAKSSPRLERWLMEHKVFGPSLRRWRESGAIPRRAKYAALIGMALGLGLLWGLAHPPLWVVGLVAAVMLAALAFIFSRPD